MQAFSCQHLLYKRKYTEKKKNKQKKTFSVRQDHILRTCANKGCKLKNPKNNKNIYNKEEHGTRSDCTYRSDRSHSTPSFKAQKLN